MLFRTSNEEEVFLIFISRRLISLLLFMLAGTQVGSWMEIKAICSFRSSRSVCESVSFIHKVWNIKWTAFFCTSEENNSGAAKLKKERSCKLLFSQEIYNLATQQLVITPNLVFSPHFFLSESSDEMPTAGNQIFTHGRLEKKRQYKINSEWKRRNTRLEPRFIPQRNREMCTKRKIKKIFHFVI